MVSEIVGRETELAALRGFIDDVHEGPAALELEGEAGIGKSTLWLAGVEHARERRVRVLSSRPAEAECGLAHVGLSDLFDGVLDDVLPALAPPRRRALEGALLLEEAADRVDPRALGLAVRSSLQLLAEDERILVAIDDVQWLDDSSARALAFALRRLGAADILFLLARRLEDGARPSGARAGARRGERPSAAGGPTQCRRPASVPARPARAAVRTSDTAPHPREVGRKSVLRRWSWPAFSMRTSIHCSRSRYRRRSRSSCARGSRGSPPPPARPWRSRRRSARPRRLSCSGPGSRRTRSSRRSPHA